MYTAIKTFDNGLRQEQSFEDYDAMVDWFVESPEAGVMAYTEVGDVNQIELQDDIAARL